MSMWGALGDLAKKAKAVAADLEGQLDESVGVEKHQQMTQDNTVFQEEENAWNDDFPMDDDLDGKVEPTAADPFAGSTSASSPSAVADETPLDAPFESPTAITSTTKEAEVFSAMSSPMKAINEPIPEAPIEGPSEAPVEAPPGEGEGWNEDPDPDLLDVDPVTEDTNVSEPKTPVEAPIVEETPPESTQIMNPTTSPQVLEETFTQQRLVDDEFKEEKVAEETLVKEIPAESNDLPTPEMAESSVQQEAITDADAAMNSDAMRAMQQQLSNLQLQLQQREDQLFKHTEQMTTMQNLYESERQEWEKRVENTKEEARRRLAIAKERIEAAEKRATAASSSSSDSAAEKDEIIAALREEGGKLANKQMEMEKLVRTAKGEARDLRAQLEEEEIAKEDALKKVSKLEAELKTTKADLSAARKGESQASKLEVDLHSAREDAERKATAILALEQQVKELKASSKELVKELEAARKGAAIDSEREQKKLKKEHNSVLEDLETKLRTTEKEAAVREDALRHEVSELRKRWQDAVRRADSLSMDVQSSTAPLLRQLESMERQNRTRAAGWADLETKLRQELEEAIEDSEKLQKERTDIRTKHQRLERQFKEAQSDLTVLQNQDEEKTKKINDLKEKVSEMETTHEKQKQEWNEVQRLANEGVARVRSEMTQTVVEAEERHVSQIDALKNELRQERDKKQQLEKQVSGLLDKATAMVLPTENGDSEPVAMQRTPAKRLSTATGQAEILVGALSELGEADSDGEGDDPENADDKSRDDDDFLQSSGGGSFAALEELQSRLKVAKIELQALRKSLSDSEKTREKLVAELAEAKVAKERLPLFEKKVEELTAENNEMTMEIRGLQDDIAEVRELYRAQLNVLLEEKAALAASEVALNGDSDPSPEEASPEADTSKDNEDFEEMRLAKKD